MSILYEEIRGLLRQVASHEDGRITANILFPKDFTGFKGHFPGNPVVPGVCKVLSVLVLLDASQKTKAVLKTIVLAKFLSLVTCDQEVCVELWREHQRDAQRVKAVFKSADKKVAEIQIEVTYA
ncbi:MAG: hypothetical protein V2A70_02495 [Candidatus Omnitrophota bacterium]